MESTSSGTYESTKALHSTESLPDKIHWDGHTSYRDEPYRQLHHQRGLMGLFRVRLLEASQLKRSYWSALALGPVKHLGLSKAHGDVSAFCTFSLKYTDSYPQRPNTPKKHTSNDWDRKMPATKKPQPALVSPVVHSNNNPVWDNCKFEFPLIKGCLPTDGMRIQLQVQVMEDSTAVENMLPGIPSGGTRLLGQGQLDITELCLGESQTGQVLPGVRDAWITLSLPPEQHKSGNHDSSYHQQDPLAPPPPPPQQPSVSGKTDTTGKVRVLVSYEPIGLEPQPRDIVALEAFARRSLVASTCRPILPPLMPLTVVDRRGSFLLCEYLLPDTRRKACVRLHRNAVFVIERQNLGDAARNLALLPVDVVMSTPVGQAAARALAPAAAATKELFLPAVLSAKLLWMAGRTTTLAGISGVQALSRTLWQEGSSSLTARHRENSAPDGLASFVQL